MSGRGEERQGAARSGARLVVLLAMAFAAATSAAQSVDFLREDAVVWAREQVIRGAVTEATATSATLWHDGAALPLPLDAGTFALPVLLAEGTNRFVAEVETAAGTLRSDTLRFTLGYTLRPEVALAATVAGRTVTLRGSVLENPDGGPLGFTWRLDPANPEPLALAAAADTVAAFDVPAGAAEGEYYVDLLVADADGDSARARTFVTVFADSIVAFDLARDHAAWVDRAVIYEVTPYIFHERGGLADVTGRLEELAAFGVTTIWLQPIFGTGYGGQGYDITDYFGIRPDYGTEADLRALVEKAHGLGLKVILDFVPNHTSDRHPYARHAAAHGARSHYYDFYLHEGYEGPYAQHLQAAGGGFMTYFWENLLIIDYRNPEVYRWMMEAGRYWIERFDVDGYRIDAVWGVNARTPEAMRRWRYDLKRLKPEILLLGEDKATWPESFDDRFDVAYDWTPEESWISHWSWQTSYDEEVSRTIFKYVAQARRAEALRNALTNRGAGFHPDAKVLRFLENNDTPRFIKDHSVSQTRMAASLLFALPGVPLVYNGQEAGRLAHPYQTEVIFFRDRTLADQDTRGVYPRYRHLIQLRRMLPALWSDHFEEVAVGPEAAAGQTYAFRRWAGDEHVLAVINMGSNEVTAELALPVSALGLVEGEATYLTDLFTGEARSVTPEELGALALEVEPYTTRLFALADEAVSIPVARDASPELPEAARLAPAYPNPFATATVLAYELAAPGPVRLAVYDLLGREVALLLDGTASAGRHETTFDARALPSGVYVALLRTGYGRHTRTLVVTR